VSSPRRSQSGFTLIEVLIAMTLMLVVMGATLTVFSTMERNSRDNQRINDQERAVRVATDVLAKRLRNLASPQNSGSAPQALERANATDLIFRTVDSTGTASAVNPENLERYRYCLGTGGKLYVERQSSAAWTATPPNPTTCGPGDGWPGTSTVAAQDVVNNTRPVFKYQISPVPGTYSEQSTVTQANFPNDIAIRTDLYVDADTAHAPKESTISTRVFLRNQNRPPTAGISATYTGTSLVTLNGSNSVDPENNPLYYQWLDGSTIVQKFSQQATYSFRGEAGSSHTFTLVVRDIGGLQVTSTSIAITCTTSTPTVCSGPTS
jgi:prepilin-type N-terminal cleavage/methylation domain-containing protein